MAEAPTAGPASERLYAIGELARELDITTRAIRFYEAKGLISPKRKGAARSYGRRDRARLILILRGKNLGFSLDEIKGYLELYDADPMQVAQLNHLLAKLDQKLKELRRKRVDLDRTAKELREIRRLVMAALKQRKRTRGSS